jgi:hypothetical protein
MFLKSFMYESQTNAGGWYQVQSSIGQRFLKMRQIRQHLADRLQKLEMTGIIVSERVEKDGRRVLPRSGQWHWQQPEGSRRNIQRSK